MANDITPFLQPSSLQEAMEAAKIMANSTLVPEAFQGKAGDILIAGQMGAELGVSWMQALSNIAVINGRPAIWGDLTLALVRKHPDFESIEETYDADSQTATCVIKRKSDKKPVTQTFSWQDAIDAGLTGKDTYQKYKRRMLQMRARSWAIRDCMPDALRGISIAEEVMDIEPRPTDIVVEAEGGVDKVKEALAAKDALASAPPPAPALEDHSNDANPLDELQPYRQLIANATDAATLKAAGASIKEAGMACDELRDRYVAREAELKAAPLPEAPATPDFFGEGATA